MFTALNVICRFVGGEANEISVQPIALTNTVSIGKVYDALFSFQFEQADALCEEDIESARRMTIPVVGETFDGLLNDIRRSVIDNTTVYRAIEAAETQPEILEGNHGGLNMGQQLHNTQESN